MCAKRVKRKKIAKKLFTKNRLVILNEDTFEEIFSLRLTLMNVFVVATLGAVVIIFVTTYIIAFTPLREYIPGYASDKLKKEATALALKSDSLAVAVRDNQAYLAAIKRVLSGDLEYAQLNKDSIKAGVTLAAEDQPNASQAELSLREDVAREDKYNLFEKAGPVENVVFFAPVRGAVTQKFNASKKQYAVEIAVAGNTAVKAAQNGTVLFADWTPSAGNVLILRHNHGFLSVYKNVGALTAAQGDVVRSGEVIGLTGSTGKSQQGAHLRFELWQENHPIDPQQFIAFE